MGSSTVKQHLAAVVGVLVLVLGLLASSAPREADAATNPTISGVSPTSGVVTGGNPVTVTGEGFLPGAALFIGGSPASGVVVVSGTRISATAPRGTLGSANVTVTNADGGSQTLNGGYFYTEPGNVLTLTSLSTTSGPIRGGTQVTLTGTGFSGSTVTFGGAPATNVSTLGPSVISLRTPPGLAGPVTVTVRNGDGATTSLASAFTYQGGSLEVSGITPSGGLAAGGAAVRISGYGFAGGSSVAFGSVPATNVVVVNPTLIMATAPAAAAGTVSVAVSSGSASASLPNAFTYRTSATASGLTLTTISPNTGPAVGGTLVTLTGTGFSGGAALYFGNVPATDVSSPGSSTILARTPLNVAGNVPVTVVNSDGSSVTLASGFTYEGSNGFALTSVSPSTGPAAGGSVIVISGAGFVSGAMVTVGGANASNVWVVGDSQLYATTPAGGAGAATVTVTNPGGLSASLASGFTYGAGGTTPPPSATPPASSGASAGFPLPARGFGLVVFGGGTNAQLMTASQCTSSSLAFWSTNASGEFDVFVPGAAIAAVNAAWNARYASGIPASTPLIGRCQS
jgi:hypothetical protein